MSAFNWVKVDSRMRRGLVRGASSGARDLADYAEEVLQVAGRTGRTITLEKASVAEALGVSVRSVERAVKELIERTVLGPVGEGRGCNTFDLTYARVGMNQAELDDERAKQQAADKRKSAQMQQATVLKFKGAQTDAESERKEVMAA